VSDLPPPSGSTVEQLWVELVREREISARLREVVESAAAVHAADLVVRDRQIAELADRVSQLERKAGRDSSTSGKPPSSDNPYTKVRKKPTDRSLRAKTGRKRG
jgi:transposase